MMKNKIKYLLIASVLIVVSASMILAIGVLPLPIILIFLLLSISGLSFGASRVSRDIIVKNATPTGQIGVVFGFSGLARCSSGRRS